MFSGCCSFRNFCMFFLHLTKILWVCLAPWRIKNTHKTHSGATKKEEKKCILNSFSIYKFSNAQKMEFTTLSLSLSHSLYPHCNLRFDAVVVLGIY